MAEGGNVKTNPVNALTFDAKPGETFGEVAGEDVADEDSDDTTDEETDVGRGEIGAVT